MIIVFKVSINLFETERAMDFVRNDYHADDDDDDDDDDNDVQGKRASRDS